MYWKWERNKKGKWTKVPCNSRGAACDAHFAPSWNDFSTAVGIAESQGLGIGFVFNGDGIVGIDLDDCRNPDTGSVKQWAADIIAQLNTYSEVSPSGTGIKLFVRGELPTKFDKQYAHPDHDGEVEIYKSGRFFTVTGNRADGTPDDVQDRPAELRDVLSLVQRWKPEKHTTKAATPLLSVLHSQTDDRATALAALAALDPNMAHGEWIRVGMALHSVDTGLLDEWDRWSSLSPDKYVNGDCAKRWSSFNGDGVSIGTLYRYFPDKAAILRALAMREAEAHHRTVMEILNGEAPGMAPDRAIIRAFVRAFAGRNQARRIAISALLAHADHRELAAKFAAGESFMTDANGRRLTRVQAFVLGRAVQGAMRAAVFEDADFLLSQEFEDELVRLGRAYLGYRSSSAG